MGVVDRFRWVRTWRGAVAATVVVLLGVVLWAVVPGASGRSQAGPPPLVRVSACLLVGAGGVNSEPTASVWKGMQDASAATNTMASLTTIPGTPSLEQAEVMVNTLATQHCAVVVAADPLVVRAVEQRATAFPRERFVVVDKAASAPNVQALNGTPDALRSAVVAAMRGVVATASPN